MTRILWALLITVLAATAQAQAPDVFPALYRVAGVAADDVLNVRVGPGAGNEIVATLPPNSGPYEVVARDADTGWLLLNTGSEVAGYVSPRFVERLPAPSRNVFPAPLSCGGTEPFWGLSFDPGGFATYYDPETPDLPLTVDWTGPAAARAGAEFGAALSGSGMQIHGVIQRLQCDDGMSDNEYGLKADMIVRSGGRTFMLTGCCSLLR